MKTSTRGRGLIIEFEGLRLTKYQDVAGLWTIGVGHLIKPGENFDSGVTRSAALALLTKDLQEVEDAVNTLVLVRVNQNQFDALVSFTFNVGKDIDADTIAEGLGDSTLLKKLNAKDYTGAAKEFPKWNKAGGKVVAGLTRRRLAEMALFMEGL